MQIWGTSKVNKKKLTLRSSCTLLMQLVTVHPELKSIPLTLISSFWPSAVSGVVPEYNFCNRDRIKALHCSTPKDFPITLADSSGSIAWTPCSERSRQHRKLCGKRQNGLLESIPTCQWRGPCTTWLSRSSITVDCYSNGLHWTFHLLCVWQSN